MRELTKAEEQIMQVLWQIEKGFVKDIREQLSDPRPAYNTVSTIVRILEKKGFVGYRAYGKTHEYYPLIGRAEYMRFSLNNLVKGYFNGSFQSLVSFFAKENRLDLHEIEALKRQLEEIQSKKS